MFTGEYNHTIDAKGRLIIPAKFREGLGEKFWIAKGLDGCLNAYSDEEWEKLDNWLKSLPSAKKETRAVKRFFMSGAIEAELDKQGRTLLTSQLREHAGLTKDVVLVGVGDKVEIWSAERWASASAPENIEDMAESLGDIGFNL